MKCFTVIQQIPLCRIALDSRKTYRRSRKARPAEIRFSQPLSLVLMTLFTILLCGQTPDLASGGPSSFSDQVVPERIPGHPPFSFIENRGQWDRKAKFMVRAGGYLAWLEEDAITLQQEQPDGENQRNGLVVRMNFEGASDLGKVEGEKGQSAVFHYFSGNDRSRWHSNVGGFRQVLYRQLYEGIDMRVRQAGELLEYDLLLAPGADPGRVVVHCQGIEKLEIDPDGSLLINTAFGPIRQKPPLTWYEMPDGSREMVDCHFMLIDELRYSFHVPDLNPELAMVIDPGLEWSTYLGSPGFDWQGFPNGFAVTDNGEVLVTGRTASAEFPTTVGAYNTTFGGDHDIFVSRFDPEKSGEEQLLWSTFIGGNGFDDADVLKLEDSGNILLAGRTSSQNYPIANNATAYDISHNGSLDGHITRLAPDGSTLLYSTFIGGLLGDHVFDIAIQSPGIIYLVGWTFSPDFPTTPGAFDAILNNENDVFAAQLDLNQNGHAQLTWSTHLGGGGDDFAGHCALDPSGMLIVAGETSSSNFPTTPGAFRENYLGGFRDAFFARLDPTQTGAAQLSYASYFGGSDDENANAMDVNPDGIITLAGWTTSADMPIADPATAYDATINGAYDAYVSQFDLSQTGNDQLIYSTFVGGSFDEGVNAMAVDDSGRVVIGGFVASLDFPTTPNGFDLTNNGAGDGFNARLDPRKTGPAQLDYSTFLGTATSQDVLLAVAASGADTIYSAIITGADFPTTDGAFDRTYNGDADIALTKIVIEPLNPVSLMTPRNLQATALGNQVDLLWDSPLPAGELGYDDGTAEFPGSFGNGATGQTAVRFTPKVYPTTLLGIKVLFFDQGGGEDDNIAYSVWVNPDGGHAPPLTEVLPNTPYTVQNRGAFEEIDISGNGIEINAGDFFLSLSQLDTIGFAQGVDENEPFGKRGWIRFDGSAVWQSMLDIAFPYDLVIRAIVLEGSGPGARIAELDAEGTPKSNHHFPDMNASQETIKLSAENFKKTVQKQRSLFGGTPAKPLSRNRYRFPTEMSRDNAVNAITGLLGYNLYRSEDGTIFSKIASLDSVTTAFQDNNVIDGATYSYYVTAVFDEGESSPSNTVEVILGDAEPLLFLNHTPGDLTMSIFNIGSIGQDPSFAIGNGVTWKGTQGLFFGGLIFGTAAAASVNGHPIYSGHDMVNLKSKFNDGFTSDANFDQITEAVMSDGNASNPFGVEVVQRSYTNSGDDFAFVRYGFVNTTGAAINGFYSGINCDWDIANYLTNSGGYAPDRNLVYEYDPVAGGPYFGIAALNGVSGMRVTTVLPSRTEVFSYITTDPPALEPNNDLRSWIGTGPLDLALGDTVWTTFAIVAGDDLEQIRKNAADASQKAFMLGWINTPTGIAGAEGEIPWVYGLKQSYPNPFNPSTTIEFTLPEAVEVTLTIYNGLGQEVATLVKGRLPAGLHSVIWQAKDLPSGVYFYRLNSGTFSQTRKMLLMK